MFIGVCVCVCVCVCTLVCMLVCFLLVCGVVVHLHAWCGVFIGVRVCVGHS